MQIYIRSVAALSPQKTFGEPDFFSEPSVHTGNHLRALEPDYTTLIDPKTLRRMSRVIKMGVATAFGCLNEAGEKAPGAIVTGTAYGCLEDTETFLKHTIERNEEMPPPTPFIQSTHNTVGAQIALILQCNQYNNTFVHRGFSFESALLDAMLLIKDGEADHVLAGSVDELTKTSFTILERFGLYKRDPIRNMDLYNDRSKGTIAGEGAAFFLLATTPTDKDYAVLDGLHTFYKPNNTAEIQKEISSFLESNGIHAGDIDIVITGNNGDAREDEIYDEVKRGVFTNNLTVPYKHLCGEYPTSVSFALWMAAQILKNQRVPGGCGYQAPEETKIKRILIYNHYQGIHHSLLLLSAI